MYEEPDQLGSTTAGRCLAIVTAWLQNNSASVDPDLQEPGRQCGGWAVVSEHGDPDWPWRMSQDESVNWPPGVFAEPVNNACLGLYAERSRRP